MKKRLILVALVVSAVATFAQDAYKVVINYRPEQIEILPGVYEFLGEIAEGGDATKSSYALSVNENLVKDVAAQLEKNVPQVLYGPRLEKLVQKKIVEDYRQKRLEKERSIKTAIAAATDAKSKKALRVTLKAERKISKTSKKRLKDIVARYNVRAIYVYGRGTKRGASSGENEEPD